ncbi:MAG: hypothetical protein HZA81_01065 [Candidatus Taylorbacteria bacterium]|nr:hypothetical protein [Candidatus Taylorbacteria bacterium]
MEKNPSREKGSLLIEILVAVAVFAAVAAMGAQSTLVGLRSSEIAGEKTAASNLLSEMSSAIQGAVEERWANLYDLAKDGTKYHVALSGNRWVIAAGEEALAVGGITYGRYFTVSNVSRDSSTRDIELAYEPLRDDPSTQKVDIVVAASSTEPLVASQYFFRWRNKVCNQTAWTSGGSAGVKDCPDTTYASQTNLTTGASLELDGGI